MMAKNPKKESITWSFKEYEKYERDRGWYLLACIIGASLLVYAILTSNFLFALIIIMVGMVLVIKHHNEPDKSVFEINNQGIKFNKNEYKYSDIENFWIIYQPPEVKNLYINFKFSLKPRLSIPINDESPLAIKTFLRQYLAEDLEQENEPASETLGRLLKL